MQTAHTFVVIFLSAILIFSVLYSALTVLVGQQEEHQAVKI